MQKNIRFVQDDYLPTTDSGKKPHGLEPNLKTVSHPPDLADKILIPNEQF
jgi:hypothetical protein